ncbi:hypothetical protein Tco_1457328 [Tanacetum coccineum]
MIVLIFEVGERLMLFEEVIDDDFAESRVWHIFTSRSSFLPVINLVSKVFPNQHRIVDILSVEHDPHYVNPGFSDSVIACRLPRETLVDYYCQISPWLTHNLSEDFNIDSALLVGQKEFIRICALDLLDRIPELLHKNFRNICRDRKCLEARGVLDLINRDLKCLFLLWHSGFQSYIGRANLDSISRWNLFFITSSNLLCFLRIHDSA